MVEKGSKTSGKAPPPFPKPSPRVQSSPTVHTAKGSKWTTRRRHCIVGYRQQTRQSWNVWMGWTLTKGITLSSYPTPLARLPSSGWSRRLHCCRKWAPCCSSGTGTVAKGIRHYVGHPVADVGGIIGGQSGWTSFLERSLHGFPPSSGPAAPNLLPSYIR